MWESKREFTATTDLPGEVGAKPGEAMARSRRLTESSCIWGELLVTLCRSRTGRRADLRLLALAVAGALGSAHCASPTEAPDPPGGGLRYELSYEVFVTEISPVLTAAGCNAGGDCHGGGIRGSYRLSSVEEEDLERDFEETRLQVFPFALDESPLLRKPLAEVAGGDRHEYEPFASSDDPRYRALWDWVHGGTYQ